MNRTAISIACAVVAIMAASGARADVSVTGAVQLIPPPESLARNACESNKFICAFEELGLGSSA